MICNGITKIPGDCNLVLRVGLIILKKIVLQFKYAKISSAINGNVKKGVVFSTYSALIGETQSTTTKYRTRLKQLLQWCGEDFDGVVSFLQNYIRMVTGLESVEMKRQ